VRSKTLKCIPSLLSSAIKKRPVWELLLPLTLSPPPRAGAPMAGELRCQCLQTETAVIHPKRVAHVELIPEGPHCEVPEVIATTKHGKKVCLDPTAPWVKLIVTKIMNRSLHLCSRLKL
uniref:C-X-C motif chemokine n=1 Tax=Chelonoidis abingdonii TaxID=106734 RepID=A0A8C0G5Y0_CHEAB